MLYTLINQGSSSSSGNVIIVDSIPIKSVSKAKNPKMNMTSYTTVVLSTALTQDD